MKTTGKIIFVLFLLPAIASAMSSPAKEPQQAQSSEINCARQAVNAIYAGNFDSAEEILKKCSVSDANTAAIKNVIAEYRRIEADREKAKRQAFKEQKAELAKLQARPESNEPNLLEILPVIIKAKEFASEQEKKQLLEDKFVQKTIEKARKLGDDYESKGQWLNALLYSYSWLDAIYEDDKEIAEKKNALKDKAFISAITETKKEIEEKAIIKAMMEDNPCETYADRYQKITPQMFVRGLDVLEYGYVEPVSYGNMTKEVFKRFEYLAEVLKYRDPCDSNFTMPYLPDKLAEFDAGLVLLKSNYATDTEPVIMTRDKFVKLFGQILSLNISTINLPNGVVISHFAESALSTLDPHTIFIWPKQVEDFDKSMTAEFSGIGVEISKADGLLKAVSLLPGPAYNSGVVDAGDVIEKVNGENTRDMTVGCAVSKITGPAGTKVVLTIRKPDQETTFEVELVRAKIIVPTTRGWGRNETGSWQYFVDDASKVGYVRLSQFSATTAGDLGRILSELESQGLKALVLDLRYNTGGYLQSAAAISDMFIDKGVIVSSQPRIGLPTWEAAHKKGTHPNYPVVILINGASASASEIVAGALSDKNHSRAVLVGQQSYGKGSVQTVTEYTGESSQLKYTMAYYHLPSGQRVKDRWAAEKAGRKDWGIMPNVKIELNSDELKKLFDIQRENDVLAAADHDNNKAKLIRHNLAETLEADKQLAVAVLIAKTKLIEAGLK